MINSDFFHFAGTHRSPLYRTLFTIIVISILLCSCSTVKQSNIAADDTASSETEDSSPAQGKFCKLPAESQGDEAGLEVVPESEEAIEKELAGLRKLRNWEETGPNARIKIDSTRYDFPVTMNEQVEYYIEYFTTEKRDVFGRWLTRSGRYVPMIQEHLKEMGLPLDLAYLAMIESGFILTANSHAQAVGPWQFIKGTGLRFGLTINEYLDERRDPVKSTRAAAAYLGKLYKDFQSWHLAVAAYNAGEGKIQRGLNQFGSKTFWQLAQHDYLALETKRYVPMLIAAIILAKDPENFGFTEICYEEPLAYETVTVPRWTSIKAVASAADLSVEELRKLNAELRRDTTPPDFKTYALRVPVGTTMQVAQNLHRIKPVVQVTYKDHVIKKGETVTSICRKYNVDKTTLLRANNLRSSNIIAGKHLRIPLRTTQYEMVASSKRRPGAPEERPENLSVHMVQKGETLSLIANRYNVTEKEIVEWNSLANPDSIPAGKKLALYVPGKPYDPSTLTGGIKTLAAEKSKSKPNNGDRAVENRLTYYSVRGGDTLWTIAQKYNLTPQVLRQWNNLSDDNIQPGLRLVIKVEGDIDA